MRKPAYLYRYCPWDDCAKLSLLRGKLYAPTPHQFNDPFDCRIPATFQHHAQEYAQNVTDWADRINTRYGKTVIQVIPGLQNGSGYILKLDYQEYVTQVNRRTRLLCFSSIQNNLLMWAHYAGGHLGICLKFRVTGMNAFCEARKVNYSNACPVIDLYRDEEKEIIEKTMLWKSSMWRYEKEWRLLFHNMRDEYLAFSPDDLSAVIIGCEMPNSDRSELLSILYDRGLPVRVYEATKSEWKYGLEIEGLVKFG